MKNNRKRIPVWTKIVLVVLAVLLLGGVAGAGYAWSKLDKINKAEEVEKVEPEEEYFEPDEEEKGYEEVNPEDVTWSSSEEVFGDDNVLNLLLIGQDRRPGEGRARSDSMMIMTINKTDKTIKLTSLMRDLYVQIPGYSDNRINAAYAFGGMELLDATIKQNFDINIDGNIEVDFSGFQKVIDTIGGIELDVHEDEIKVLNDYVRELDKMSGESENANIVTQAGVQHLNGLQALAYSRIRYVGNGDFGRTERQRKVLMAAFDKVKNSGLNEMLKLADTIFPLLTTDMSNSDLIGVGVEVLGMGVSEIETHNIPEDASFRYASIRGMSVLVPDIDKCRQVLRQVIYGE